jgi:hypothetical protein
MARSPHCNSPWGKPVLRMAIAQAASQMATAVPTLRARMHEHRLSQVLAGSAEQVGAGGGGSSRASQSRGGEVAGAAEQVRAGKALTCHGADLRGLHRVERSSQEQPKDHAMAVSACQESFDGTIPELHPACAFTMSELDAHLTAINTRFKFETSSFIHLYIIFV